MDCYIRRKTMASNSNGTPKWVLYTGGIASIAVIIGVIIAYFNYVHPPNPNPPIINLNMATPNTIPVSVPSTPTSTPTWNVILDDTYNTLTYNNYTVHDTQGHHFLIVHASFSNISSDAQSLNRPFDLQDENGQHYPEDQASTPGNSFAVDPGKSIELW